jgi:hypothetical protein
VPTIILALAADFPKSNLDNGPVVPMPTGPPVNRAEYVALLKVLVAVNVFAAFSSGTLLAAMPLLTALPLPLPESKLVVDAMADEVR